MTLFRARRRAENRLGQRLTPAEVRAGLPRARVSDQFRTRGGWARRCPCRAWFVARVSYSWSAHEGAFGHIRAGSRTTRRQRCRVCTRATDAARAARGRQARSQRRAALRVELGCTRCGRCGRAMAAARTTRRYCSTACRVAAHRNANGLRSPGATTSVSVTPQRTRRAS